MTSALKFITWPAIAGILAALVILDRLALPGADTETSQSSGVASYSTAVDVASPSVVNIDTKTVVRSRQNPMLSDPFFRNYAPPQTTRQQVTKSLGSGVIMSREGHILTNNHVIAGADAIRVLLVDGRIANAVVIGTDQATDLAVLKIELPDLQPIATGDSNAIRVGDVVLAIGNPLGFSHSVTQGIVSALGRWGLRASTYEDYIQTDASIHLGNSGGALIDTQGRLLGINTLIFTTPGQSKATATGIGIGLAIPANLAVFVMDDLIEYGEVIRGWLGVRVKPLRQIQNNSSQTQALVVAGVAQGSPAQKAGIALSDIITHIDGEPVIDGRLTMHQIALLRPGDKISVTVQRNQQSIDLKVIVGSLRQSRAES